MQYFTEVADLPFGSNKSKITKMEHLKLSDIVERGRLNRWNAAYALKHPDMLFGMPEGGKQGVHRQFDPKQAFRLALFTQLISCGFGLKVSSWVLRFAESRLRQIEIDRRLKAVAEEDRPTGASMLWIDDSRWISVDSADRHKKQFWVDITTNKNVPEHPAPLRRMSINLSLLRQSLEKEKTE